MPEWGLSFERQRVLVVDDDPGFRLLLRTTLAADEFLVEEASSAEQAEERARFWRPSIVILDVGLPGASGLELCRLLKGDDVFGSPRVILLTGAETNGLEAQAAGADGLLHKPFSPLDLISLIERLPARAFGAEIEPDDRESEQFLVYARDLGRLLQLERSHRRLLQQAYRQTVVALSDALEARDARTGKHARRVQRYALELTRAIDASLLDDQSLEYGFLLHDVGKLAIPDQILNKPGPLREQERQLIEQHPLIGSSILREIALLQGEGLRVVRSHHERWDGRGYPDRLAEQQIPVGARIFAVADALDAMTSDRPYRDALPWNTALTEIRNERRRQFDPTVVIALTTHEHQLRRIHAELAAHQN